MALTFDMQELEGTGKVSDDLTCLPLSEVDVFLDAGQQGPSINFFKHKIEPTKNIYHWL